MIKGITCRVSIGRGKVRQSIRLSVKPFMRKKTTAFVVTIIALLALAFALNPSPEKHRAKIREAIAERSPLAGALGVGVLTAFVSAYHSLGVASYTVVNDRLVTIGAFGGVFLVQQGKEG